MKLSPSVVHFRVDDEDFAVPVADAEEFIRQLETFAPDEEMRVVARDGRRATPRYRRRGVIPALSSPTIRVSRCTRPSTVCGASLGRCRSRWSTFATSSVTSTPTEFPDPLGGILFTQPADSAEPCAALSQSCSARSAAPLFDPERMRTRR
jgi:hypothetical protein